MKAVIQEILQESGSIKQKLASDEKFCDSIAYVAKLLIDVGRAGGTIYACGNGGSACDCMHFCEELVSRYKRERPGIRAVHLMDAGIITCWSNDYNFSTVFKRQVETFCTSKDVLVGFSTSGNSGNIIEGLKAAKSLHCPTILFTGKDGGQALRIADHSIVVPVWATERIQEVHITIVHILCELLET